MEKCNFTPHWNRPLWILVIISMNLIVLNVSVLLDLMKYDIDSLVQDCTISSSLAMEMLQSHTKPSI